MPYELHQAAHALFSARTERGDNLVVAEPGCKRFDRDGDLAGINAEAGKRTARAKCGESALEGLRCAEGLNSHIDASSSRQPAYCRADIFFVVVQNHIRAHALRHLDPHWIRLHSDHQAGAFETRANGCTQADRPLRKYSYRIAEPQIGRFRS